MPAAMGLILLLLLWLSPVAPNQETGSCFQSQPLCRIGMDHQCRRGSCYCDEFFHVVPDCCPDHQALCKPRNAHAGSFPPPGELEAVTDRAPQTTSMMLQIVLRMENPSKAVRSDVNWMQSMVRQFLQTNLPGLPFSITMKGLKKRA